MPTPLLMISALIALVVGYAAFVAYPIFQAIRLTKNLMEEAIPYEQHPDIATQKILVMGDSTAVGTGAGDPRRSTAGRLGEEYPTADVTNISENGQKLDELRENLAALPESEPYDLLLLQIGANDIVGFTPLSSVRTTLAQVLELADGRASSIIVLTSGNVGLAPVFRWPLSSLLSRRTLAVRQVFLEEVRTHANATYVDLYKSREDEPFNKNIPRYYAQDHFHPSGEGYGLWYEAIQPLAEKVLEAS